MVNPHYICYTKDTQTSSQEYTTNLCNKVIPLPMQINILHYVDNHI